MKKIIQFLNMKKNNSYIKKIDIDNMPLFNQIEIETINRCNGKCSFCPVNATQPQRPYAKMTDELFKKIIDNLAEIKYKGEICLSSNNEPFLDGRMPQFIKYTAETLPQAYIYIWTNGSVVTPNNIEAAMKYLSKIYIDNYSINNELTDNVRKIITTLQKKGYSDEIEIVQGLGHFSTKKIVILNRDINEIISSRGGQAPNKKNDYNNYIIKHYKCIRPFECIVIRPTGKISLCCCDALGIYEMGDANIDSLENIWRNSQEYKRVRNHLQTKGRNGLKLCEKCDFTDF